MNGAQEYNLDRGKTLFLNTLYGDLRPKTDAITQNMSAVEKHFESRVAVMPDDENGIYAAARLAKACLFVIYAKTETESVTTLVEETLARYMELGGKSSPSVKRIAKPEDTTAQGVASNEKSHILPQHGGRRIAAQLTSEEEQARVQKFLEQLNAGEQFTKADYEGESWKLESKKEASAWAAAQVVTLTSAGEGIEQSEFYFGGSDEDDEKPQGYVSAFQGLSAEDQAAQIARLQSMAVEIIDLEEMSDIEDLSIEGLRKRGLIPEDFDAELGDGVAHALAQETISQRSASDRSTPEAVMVVGADGQPEMRCPVCVRSGAYTAAATDPEHKRAPVFFPEGSMRYSCLECGTTFKSERNIEDDLPMGYDDEDRPKQSPRRSQYRLDARPDNDLGSFDHSDDGKFSQSKSGLWIPR